MDVVVSDLPFGRKYGSVRPTALHVASVRRSVPRFSGNGVGSSWICVYIHLYIYKYIHMHIYIYMYYGFIGRLRNSF